LEKTFPTNKGILSAALSYHDNVFCFYFQKRCILNQTFICTKESCNHNLLKQSHSLNNAKNNNMKRKIYSLFCLVTLLVIANKSNAQTVTFVLTQAPCNNNGILTANFTGLTAPFDVTWHLNGGTTITHSGVTGTSDVLNGYSGAGLYITTTGGGTPQGVYGSYIGSMPFQYQITTTNAVCPAMGTATATVTGGTAPYTYQWSDATTATVLSTSNPASLPEGNFNLMITDANGCTNGSLNNYDSVFIATEPGFNYTVTVTPANCTNGTATVGSFTGAGVPPYTYLWSNGATSASITGLVQGDYAVTVTGANGCHRTVTKHVEQAITIGANPVVTTATCTQNNGSIVTIGSGGMTPYSYLYSNGVNTSVASGLSAGSYSVTVTDANGCTGHTSVSVGSSSPVNVTYTTTPSTCTGATGSASLAITGGLAPYTVSWSTIPAQTGTTATGLAVGNYYFHVTDANGCVREGAIPVPPVNVISATLTATNATCLQSNGSITTVASGGTTPYTYQWVNSTSTAATATGLPPGYYTVTITDANGCHTYKNRQIESSSPVNLGLASTPASCIYTSDGSIASSVSGGTAPYTYSWSNGQTTANISGLHASIYPYYLHVTDANGCAASEATVVTYNPAGNSCYCTITGTVYNDANGNCTKDPGEAGIANIQMHCTGYGYTYTNASGVYSFQVPTGAYSITQTVLGLYPLAACQTNNISVNTVAAAGCTQNVDFANTITPLHDMHIRVWNNTLMVPGNPYNQTCLISNEGTVSESGILASYQNDGQLNAATIYPSGIFATASPNYYSTLGNAFPALAPGATQAFTINYIVPTNIPLGTQVVFKDSAVYAAPMSGWLNDYSPWNNVETRTEHVISSYDPNFMDVSTQGEGEQGYITAADSSLEYMVHFQNTGTYFAQNIFVLDTLSSNLDWTSLRPIYSSHNAKVSIDDNGVLKYTFNNIQLPAESMDEAASNGMFTFSIKVKPNLAAGTQIYNNAGIIFDYNQPVITNKVLNTIKPITAIKGVESNKLSFNIYPNPAQSSFVTVIENNTANASIVISIADISGRIITTKEMKLPSGKQTIQMNTADLKSGIYFVNLNMNGQKGTQKLVIVK
jgi:hypothetical protein